MNNILTREIIRHILTRFGFISTKGNCIYSDDFKLEKKLPLSYEDKTVINHDIYGTSINFGEGKQINLCVLDLGLDETYEFCCIFWLDGGPFYALKLVLDDDDFGSFKYLDGQLWKPLGLKFQGKLLTAIENIFDQGLKFSPFEGDKDMIIEMFKKVLD